MSENLEAGYQLAVMRGLSPESGMPIHKGDLSQKLDEILTDETVHTVIVSRSVFNPAALERDKQSIEENSRKLSTFTASREA